MRSAACSPTDPASGSSPGGPPARIPGPLVDDQGALRLAPEDHGTDGYYAALLQRTDA